MWKPMLSSLHTNSTNSMFSERFALSLIKKIIIIIINKCLRCMRCRLWFRNWDAIFPLFSLGFKATIFINNFFFPLLKFVQACNQSVCLFRGWQLVTVRFGDMVCTTLNIYYWSGKLSQEIRKKVLDKHIKGKGYKTASKQFDVLVTTIAYYLVV